MCIREAGRAVVLRPVQKEEHRLEGGHLGVTCRRKGSIKGCNGFVKCGSEFEVGWQGGWLSKDGEDG